MRTCKLIISKFIVPENDLNSIISVETKQLIQRFLLEVFTEKLELIITTKSE
jgi:hypothetical protein